MYLQRLWRRSAGVNLTADWELMIPTPRGWQRATVWWRHGKMDSGASEKCVETRQTKGQRSEARVEGPRQGEMRGSPLTRDTGDQGTVRRHQRTLPILPAYWHPDTAWTELAGYQYCIGTRVNCYRDIHRYTHMWFLFIPLYISHIFHFSTILEITHVIAPLESSGLGLKGC